MRATESRTPFPCVLLMINARFAAHMTTWRCGRWMDVSALVSRDVITELGPDELAIVFLQWSLLQNRGPLNCIPALLVWSHEGQRANNLQTGCGTLLFPTPCWSAAPAAVTWPTLAGEWALAAGRRCGCGWRQEHRGGYRTLQHNTTLV